MEREFDRLAASLGWSPEQVARILDEVRSFYSNTVSSFVQARHFEYKNRLGLRNEEIYPRIQEDVRRWRFRAPELTVRQIRRMIYG